MITLQAHQTLSPATPLWMHPMPCYRPHPVTTIAKGLPLTCQKRHGLEAFPIPCPLPGTPSTLLWIPRESIYSDLSITMISLAQRGTRVIKVTYFLYQKQFSLDLSPYYFLWPVYFSKHFWSWIPIWLHLPLHSYPSHLSHCFKGETSSSFVKNSSHSHLASMSPPCSAISFDLWEKKSEVTQLCPALCDPIDCSLPGSSIHGIFQARVLEWAAISFSRGSSWPRDWTWVSRIAGRHFTIWATWEALT